MTAKPPLTKYMVFPIIYLVLELIEDFLIYKVNKSSIEEVWIRTLAMIGILIFVISVVAFFLVPFIHGGLESLGKSHKKHGPAGKFFFTLFLFACIFTLYFQKVEAGGNIEALLPSFLID